MSIRCWWVSEVLKYEGEVSDCMCSEEVVDVVARTITPLGQHGFVHRCKWSLGWIPTSNRGSLVFSYECFRLFIFWSHLFSGLKDDAIHFYTGLETYSKFKLKRICIPSSIQLRGNTPHISWGSVFHGADQAQTAQDKLWAEQPIPCIWGRRVQYICLVSLKLRTRYEYPYHMAACMVGN